MPIALLLHAHPDDEVFANFGWASDLAAQGYDLHGVIATGGEAGELRAAFSLEEARARRLAKYETALGLMGARRWLWLGEPAEWVDADCGPTLAGADPERLRRAVERVLLEFNREIVLTVGSDGLTGHPDHVALADAARSVSSSVGVPKVIWGARLHADDVRAGEDLLHAVAPNVQMGSGRVSGTDARLMTRDVRMSAPSRRRALDAYREGFGAGSLESLLHGVTNVGDSISGGSSTRRNGLLSGTRRCIRLLALGSAIVRRAGAVGDPRRSVWSY